MAEKSPSNQKPPVINQIVIIALIPSFTNKMRQVDHCPNNTINMFSEKQLKQIKSR